MKYSLIKRIFAQYLVAIAFENPLGVRDDKEELEINEKNAKKTEQKNSTIVSKIEIFEKNNHKIQEVVGSTDNNKKVEKGKQVENNESVKTSEFTNIENDVHAGKIIASLKTQKVSVTLDNLEDMTNFYLEGKYVRKNKKHKLSNHIKNQLESLLMYYKNQISNDIVYNFCKRFRLSFKTSNKVVQTLTENKVKEIQKFIQERGEFNYDIKNGKCSKYNNVIYISSDVNF